MAERQRSVMDTKDVLGDVMNIYKKSARIVAQQRHGPGFWYVLIHMHPHCVCSYTPLQKASGRLYLAEEVQLKKLHDLRFSV